MTSAEPVLLGLAAYALGCISFGYYLVRLSTGGDIRALGSGNAGARNAGRVLGKRAFLLTLAGDGGKGALAIVLAGLANAGAVSGAVVLGAVVAGHIWPAQLGFRGGKGFATAVGAIFVFDYRLAVAVLVVTLVLYAFLRRSTPAALGATLLAPGIAYALGVDTISVAAVAMIAMMILIAHRRYFRAALKSYQASDQGARHV